MKNLEMIRRSVAQQVSKAAYLEDQAQLARDAARRGEAIAIEYAQILPALKTFFNQTRDHSMPFADQRRVFVQIIRAAAMESANDVDADPFAARA